MLEKFSNNIKKVIGIGAVAAGALTASPGLDNKSETEKYTEPIAVSYDYTDPEGSAPRGTVNKIAESKAPTYDYSKSNNPAGTLNNYTDPSKIVVEGENLSAVEKNINYELRSDLNKLGFDNINILMEYIGTESGVRYEVAIQSSVDGKQKVFYISPPKEVFNNKYGFQEFIKEAILKEINIKA